MGMYCSQLKGIKMVGLLAEAVGALGYGGNEIVQLDRAQANEVARYMITAYQTGRDLKTVQNVYQNANDARTLAALMDWVAWGDGYLLTWA